MFSQFHLKATKSRSKGAFSYALRECRLLEKKKLLPGSILLVWLLGGKNQKLNQTHPNSISNF
jgi:hypothetical protein